jgi:hypothetical protein
MANQRARQPVAPYIPEFDGVIPAIRGERPTVRRNRGGQTPTGMTSQRVQQLAAPDVPDTVVDCIKGQRPPVRRKRDKKDEKIAACQRAQQLAACRVPVLDNVARVQRG